MKALAHDDAFVQQLFDRMGPTYSLMNVVSSFGFSELWRWLCVRNAGVGQRDRVCDMMSGSGECWRHIQSRGGLVTAIDFSSFMVARQHRRRSCNGLAVDIRCENATATSLGDGSMDCVVSAFGLKTLSEEASRAFAQELNRVLATGGTFSLLEISSPRSGWLRAPYLWYLSKVIPWIGKVFLGDLECYRYLGRYTRSFESVRGILPFFLEAGFQVEVRSHFFGCATSLVGRKGQQK